MSLFDLITSPLFIIALALASVQGYVWFKKWIAGGVCESKARMDGKTVLITGGNAGLGKETALDLARRGARVIIACRDVKRGEETAAFVRQQTGNGNVVVQQLDLASFKSIRSCGERIIQTEERLDVLMNNAGIMSCPQAKTEDGNELQFGVNHLGHFLLTNLLLDLLKKSSPSRVVTLSSMAHRDGRMNWEDLNNSKNYSDDKVYYMSKLANVLFTKSLAKRLRGTGVTTYAVHPGIVKTNLFQYFWKHPVKSVVVNVMLSLVGKTPEQGYQTQLCCAVDPELTNETGKYYADCAETSPSKAAQSEDDAERLWSMSLEMTGLK